MKIKGIIFGVVILGCISGLAASPRAGQICTGAQIFSAANCGGDGNSAVEKELFDMVNKYRVENGRPAVPLSASLSKLGNRRTLDLRQNLKRITHSWSNCPYDMANQKTWPCLIDSPKRLNSGYSGQGYEALYYTTSGSVSPAAALDAWKKSSLHSSIILNQDIFKIMPWDAMGVAIDGQYAALWFGSGGGGPAAAGEKTIGLGVSYDKAIAGLSRLLSINATSATDTSNTWTGFSADRKIKLEISGTRKEISEATVAVTVALSPNGKLDPEKRSVMARLLKNCFPELSDIDVWLDNSINMISQNPNAWRARVVRKNTIEIRSDGANSLKLTIKPQSSKPQSIEIT